MVLREVKVKVSWDGPGLQVSEGDEAKVSRRGIKGEGHVRAHVLRNRTSGATFKRQAEGASTARNPADLEPPICGYARNVLVHARGTFFTLEETAPIIPSIFRQCSRFLDRRLVERCRDRDYHEVLVNALSVLEDTIRVRLGVEARYSGSKLTCCAFNPAEALLMWCYPSSSGQGQVEI
jgi:hypothetical protein